MSHSSAWQNASGEGLTVMRVRRRLGRSSHWRLVCRRFGHNEVRDCRGYRDLHDWVLVGKHAKKKEKRKRCTRFFHVITRDRRHATFSHREGSNLKFESKLSVTKVLLPGCLQDEFAVFRLTLRFFVVFVLYGCNGLLSLQVLS